MNAALDLYDELRSRFPQAPPNRKGEVYITCPWCGKEGKHFSFSPRGAYCFVCGHKASLGQVAEKLGIVGDRLPYTPPPPRPRPAVPWHAHAVEIVSRSLAHPQRIERWQAYKPLSVATLDRHQFGLHRLPFQKPDGRWYWSQQPWLTVPLYDGDLLVGLRGRNIGAQGPKWISATGTSYVLWNLPKVRPGACVWITENYVDAAWLMERHPQWDAVALGGAANWRPEWAAALAAKRPALVIVALDNDLAGQASGATYRRLQAERRQQHPGLPDLAPNGPKIANSLIAAGCPVTLYPWQPDAPDKADVGWLLAQEKI